MPKYISVDSDSDDDDQGARELRNLKKARAAGLAKGQLTSSGSGKQPTKVIHPGLWEIHLYVGSSKSGKSYLMRHVIRQRWATGKFDYIIIMTTTKFNNQWQAVVSNSECICDFSEDVLRDLLARQARDIEHENDEKKEYERVGRGNEAKFKADSILLVFDDLLGTMRHTQFFTSFVTRVRHHRIELHSSAQYIHAIDTIIRQQTDWAYIFSNDLQSNNIEALWEFAGGSFDMRKSFKKCLLLMADEQYKCMFVSCKGPAFPITAKYMSMKAPAEEPKTKINF
jgi:hypothetical protein